MRSSWRLRERGFKFASAGRWFRKTVGARNVCVSRMPRSLDVFLLHAGGFRRDRNLFFGFGDFELRPGGINEIRPAPGKRSGGEAAKGFFQKAVHFTVQGEKRARSYVAEKLREVILAPGPRNEITHVHGLFSKDLSGRTGREPLPRTAFPAKIATGFGPYDIGPAGSGEWPRSRAANSALPLTTARRYSRLRSWLPVQA